MVHASLCGFALVLLSTVPSQSKWLGDYGVALRQAELEGRPLLVVIEQPADGQQVNQPFIGADAVQGGVLAVALDGYKLCRIDASTPYGQSVARAFKATTLPHTAIIDNTASVQLFKKSGALSREEWLATLAGYRSGQQPTPRTSYRPTICIT